MDEDERLEEALKEAAAVGDTEAATVLATEIRKRRAPTKSGVPNTDSRATGDQPLTAPGGQEPPQEADPFPGIAKEINGIPISNEIRGAMAFGKTIDDTTPEGKKEKRILAAQIAGRIAQESEGGNFADQFQRSQGGAFLRSIGTGIFGIGDLAAAAGSVIGSGGDLAFGDALELQREFRRGLEEDFPLTTLAGEISGAVVGGGLAIKGVQAASGAGKVGQFFKNLTTFKGGKFLPNVGKASVLGGTAGAITEGVTEDNPEGGAAIGAAAGPAGLGIAKVVGIAATPVIRTLAKAAGVSPEKLSFGLIKAQEVTSKEARVFANKPEAKALKILAKKLGLSPEEMALRFKQYEAVLGRPPTIVELANDAAGLELKELIQASPQATIIGQELVEKNLSKRGQEIGDQITGGRVTTTKTKLDAKRNRLAEKQFAEVAKENFEFTSKQSIDLLSNPDLKRVLPPPLRRTLEGILASVGEGSPVFLRGQVVNDIRLALKKAGKGAVGADRVFISLREELEAIARAQSPKFGEAIDEFAQRSVRGEGAAAGKKVVSDPVSEFDAKINDVDSPDFSAGARVGARTSLKDTASSTLRSAKNLVNDLSTESGLIQKLRKILPAGQVDEIQRIAVAQKRAIERLSSSTPGAKISGGDDVLLSVVNSVVVASPVTSAASKTFAAGRLFQVLKRKLGIRVSNRVLNNLAKDAFDPKKTKQVIAAMRRAGLSDNEIVEIYAEAATAAGIQANN